MNINLLEEKKILKEKRDIIKFELEQKRSDALNIENKLNNLRKETKGKYDVEKEAVEKISEVLSKDIDSYKNALEAPYFGRVDFREYRGLTEKIYIGKQGINNSQNGDEIVVDWRAPVADLYYSGTGGEAYYKAPSGIIEGKLELKRKFLFEDGDIKQIFDEGINELMINGEEGEELVDKFLKINLETSRGKKLKEVVATIQKEQNDVIRWPKNLPIIVQGSAGSGKTTIALHRLAYLIYRYKEKMSGNEILVLAPNNLFLDYISDILPSLGATEVNQNTFEELILSKLKLKGKIYNKDEKLKDLMEEKDEERRLNISNSSKVKGSLLFKTILDRYIALVEGSSVEIDDIKIDDYVLFSRKEIARLYLKDLKSYPINKRKDEIKRYLNLKLKEKIEELTLRVDREWDVKIKEFKMNLKDSQERREGLIKLYDKRDEMKNNIKSNSKKEFNNYFKNWRGINPKDIYYNFFNDEILFDISIDGKVPEELARFMKNEINKNYESNIIDEDDLAPLLYIRMILEGIDEKEKFQHIVVDEAQDYSPLQIYLINKLSRGNSLTLVGDLAQGIYYYKGINKWEDITEGLFKGNATYIQLTQSYRSTVEIIDFASGALKAQKLGLKNSMPVLRHGDVPKVIEVESINEYSEVIDNIVEAVRGNGKRSIAIITKNSHDALKLFKKLKTKSPFTLIKGKEKKLEDELIIIPSYLTKGLEFDCTIILDPSEKSYVDNILDKRLLYVSLTRALHYEYIIKLNRITFMIKENNN